nr:MAG TPA: hypothetical protein [Caudoviricetes sp.]
MKSLPANSLQSAFLTYKYIFTLKCTYFFVKNKDYSLLFSFSFTNLVFFIHIPIYI